MTDYELEVLELGKATKRLLNDPDYMKVIQEGFIQSKLNALGMDFIGSEDDIDVLKAIALLQTHLRSNIEQAEIALQSNSK